MTQAQKQSMSFTVVNFMDVGSVNPTTDMGRHFIIQIVQLKRCFKQQKSKQNCYERLVTLWLRCGSVRLRKIETEQRTKRCSEEHVMGIIIGSKRGFLRRTNWNGRMLPCSGIRRRDLLWRFHKFASNHQQIWHVSDRSSTNLGQSRESKHRWLLWFS